MQPASRFFCVKNYLYFHFARKNACKEIKKELSELDKEKVAAIAKEKAEVIKEKCEELVQLAVDKGTPVLEKAAKEVREKTIDTMKDTIKKLEAKDKVKAEK